MFYFSLTINTDIIKKGICFCLIYAGLLTTSTPTGQLFYLLCQTAEKDGWTSTFSRAKIAELAL